MSQHAASVGHPDGVEVRIYRSSHGFPCSEEPGAPDTYYWCCESCGACSTHYTTAWVTINGAHKHYQRTDIPQHKEALNGQGD